MQMFDVPLLITIVNIFFLAGLLLVLFRLRSREQDNYKKLRDLSENMNAVCASAKGVGNHVHILEKQFKRLVERQHQIDMRNPDERVYDRAAKMIQNGASPLELMANCALSRAEADLLCMMHSRKAIIERSNDQGKNSFGAITA